MYWILYTYGRTTLGHSECNTLYPVNYPLPSAVKSQNIYLSLQLTNTYCKLEEKKNEIGIAHKQKQNHFWKRKAWRAYKIRTCVYDLTTKIWSYLHSYIIILSTFLLEDNLLLRKTFNTHTHRRTHWLIQTKMEEWNKIGEIAFSIVERSIYHS